MSCIVRMAEGNILSVRSAFMPCVFDYVRAHASAGSELMALVERGDVFVSMDAYFLDELSCDGFKELAALMDRLEQELPEANPYVEGLKHLFVADLGLFRDALRVHVAERCGG